jgi:hypothetical protein
MNSACHGCESQALLALGQRSEYIEGSLCRLAVLVALDAVGGRTHAVTVDDYDGIPA